MHGLFNYLGEIKALMFESRYFALTCQVEKKTIVVSFGVVIGDWLFNKYSTHAKNERINIGKHSKIILNSLKFDVHLKSPQKMFQFTTIFHLFN